MPILGCISKGFSIAKSSKNLILAVFGFSFVWALINLPFASPDNAADPGLVPAILGLLIMLISIYIQGGSIGYVERVAKQGSADLSVFFEAGKKNYFRMLGLGVVIGLVMLILAVMAIIGFVAGGPEAEPNPAAIAVAVIVAAVGLLLLLFLFLAPYAVVVDGKGVFGALKTSVSVVKRNFVKVLVVGVVLVLIGFAVGFLLGLLAGLLTGILPGVAGRIISAFLSSGVNAFLSVLTTGSFMVLYLSSSSGSSETAPAAH